MGVAAPQRGTKTVVKVKRAERTLRIVCQAQHVPFLRRHQRQFIFIPRKAQDLHEFRRVDTNRKRARATVMLKIEFVEREAAQGHVIFVHSLETLLPKHEKRNEISIVCDGLRIMGR